MNIDDEALQQKVFREYSEYLDKIGVPHREDQYTFSVYIPLQNIEHSFTKLYRKYNGKIRIGDLCGSCYKGAKSAKRLAQVIQKYCPGVEIEALHFSSVYEVLVGSKIEYTTPERTASAGSWCSTCRGCGSRNREREAWQELYQVTIP